MKYHLVILPQAKADLQRNAQWWKIHHSSEKSADWLKAVQLQLKAIIDFPEGHSLSAENDDFRYEIREKLVGLGSRPQYRAVFTIVEEVIYVLTIRAAEQRGLTEDMIDFDVT